jgi:hypothetical protein
VIDTRTVSAAIAMLAFAVQRRLERGTTDEEIDALVERYLREHELLFTLDSLDYLARGGRIGRASSLVGGLLNVKPILTIRDGEVVPLKRVRGSAKSPSRSSGRCWRPGLLTRRRFAWASRTPPNRSVWPLSRSSSRACARTRRSRWRRRSAQSSAPTRGPARSGCSGSTTRTEPCGRIATKSLRFCRRPVTKL